MCNLSSGSIDEVEQMVHMTWVQPRVLDLTQVNIVTLHFNHTHWCIYEKWLDFFIFSDLYRDSWPSSVLQRNCCGLVGEILSKWFASYLPFTKYNRELTNRRLSHDAAAGSRHTSALPSCRNLNLRFGGKDDDVGARGRPIFPPFLKFVFFFSQVSLFVQPKCLNS